MSIVKKFYHRTRDNKRALLLLGLLRDSLIYRVYGVPDIIEKHLALEKKDSKHGNFYLDKIWMNIIMTLK